MTHEKENMVVVKNLTVVREEILLSQIREESMAVI